MAHRSIDEDSAEQVIAHLHCIWTDESLKKHPDLPEHLDMLVTESTDPLEICTAIMDFEAEPRVKKLFPGCKLDDLDWTFTIHFQVAGEIAEAYLAGE